MVTPVWSASLHMLLVRTGGHIRFAINAVVVFWPNMPGTPVTVDNMNTDLPIWNPADEH